MADKYRDEFSTAFRSNVLKLKPHLAGMQQKLQKLEIQFFHTHKEFLMRLYELMNEFCQSDDEGDIKVSTKTDEVFQSYKAELIGLLGFAYYDDPGVEGRQGTAELMKEKENVKKELIELKTNFDEYCECHNLAEMAKESGREGGDARRRLLIEMAKFIGKLMVGSSSLVSGACSAENTEEGGKKDQQDANKIPDKFEDYFLSLECCNEEIDQSIQILGIQVSKGIQALNAGLDGLKETSGDVKKSLSMLVDYAIDEGVTGIEGRGQDGTAVFKKVLEHVKDECGETLSFSMDTTDEEDKEETLSSSSDSTESEEENNGTKIDPEDSKALMDWANTTQLNDDDDWKHLKAVRVQAVYLGAELSSLLVNLMFLMSQKKRCFARIVKKITRQLKIGKCVFDTHMVIDRFIILVQMVSEEMKVKNIDEMVDKTDPVYITETDRLVYKISSNVLALEHILNLPMLAAVEMGKVLRLESKLQGCEKAVRARLASRIKVG